MNTHAIIRACFFSILLPLLFTSTAPAQEPHPAWRTESIDLAVEIDPDRGVLKGDAGLQLKNLGAGDDEILLTLNHQLRVEAVMDECGRPLSFEQSEDSLAVRPQEPPFGTELRTIRIRYSGRFLERIPELDLRNAWIGGKISYAFCSSRWYPQAPDPFRRCRGRIAYLVPGNWTVASSGRLTATEEIRGAKRCTFVVASPVEFSFAAADFVHHRENIDGLEVGVFLLKGDRNKVDYYLGNCSKMIAYFKKLYGFFPYERYDLIELPQEMLGKTGAACYESLTFFPESLLPKRFFYAPVFAHEISHCWWGNCVRGAEGPVINEGLAQISMGLYLEETLGSKFFWNLLKDGAPQFLYLHSARLFFRALQTAKVKDKSLEALLMRGEDLELGIPAKDKFTTLHMLANSKGFFVFAMLRELIGPEPFKQGLRTTLEGFSWKT
ncbi:MAG: M1 family aminopeptidase, partial [Candidatus Aminicenantes bacterium]|nr:M1 family aminopeptidase [Candidatus Aminicenantes bacterium]